MRIISKLLVLLSCINLTFATIGINGFSPPIYIEYTTSISSKKVIVTNIVENSTLYDSSTIYIYYHDSKSKKLASIVKKELSSKLLANTTVILVNQLNGVPKYPYKFTPEGIAIVSKDGKCVKCQIDKTNK